MPASKTTVRVQVVAESVNGLEERGGIFYGGGSMGKAQDHWAMK